MSISIIGNNTSSAFRQVQLFCTDPIMTFVISR